MMTRVMVGVLAVMLVGVQMPQVVVTAPEMVTTVTAQSVDGEAVAAVANVAYPVTVGEIVAIVLALVALIGVVATWYRSGNGIGALDAAVAAQLSQTNVQVLATFENMFDRMDERHQATLRQIVGVAETAAAWTPSKADDAMAANFREMVDGRPVAQKQRNQMVTPGGTVMRQQPDYGAAYDADPDADEDTQEITPADMIAQAVRGASVDREPKAADKAETPEPPEPGSIGRRPKRQ